MITPIKYYYPSFILSILFVNVVLGFMNFDEEFIIFLCLLIVFLTLMETLDTHLNEYANEKIKRIKSWYFTNWNLHLFRIKNNSELLFFIENFYIVSFLFFVKILNSFFYFISYNFYLQRIYSSLLVKELLYIYEFLELNATLNSKLIKFNKQKEIFLNIVKTKNKVFPIKTLSLALQRLKKNNKIKNVKISKNLNTNLILVLKKLTTAGKIKKQLAPKRIKGLDSYLKKIHHKHQENSIINGSSKKSKKKSKK